MAQNVGHIVSEMDVVAGNLSGPKQVSEALTQVGVIAEETEARVNNTGKVMSNIFDSVGIKMTVAGASLTGFGLAAKAAFSSIIKVGGDFQAEMNHVFGVFTDGLEHQNELMNTANTVGIKYALSNLEAAQGLEVLGKAGLTATQAIGALEPVVRLAEANNLNLGDSAKITAIAMTQFSDQIAAGTLTVTDIVNGFSAAALQTVSDVGDFGEAMSHIGAVMDGLGVPFQDTLVLMAGMSKSGIESARAATGLRTSITSLLKPTKAGAAELENLGVHLKNFTSEMDIAPRPTGIMTEELLHLNDSLSESDKITAYGQALEILGVSAQGAGLNGMSTAQAFDTLRGILADPAVSPDDIANRADAFGSLGIQFLKVDGSMKNLPELLSNLRDGLSGLNEADRMTALLKIFTQRGIEPMNALLKLSDEDWQNLTTSIIDGGKQLDTLTGLVHSGVNYQLQVLSGNLEVLKTQFFQALEVPIGAVVFAFQRLVEAFISLPQPIKAIIGSIIAFVAVLGAVVGPLLTVAGLLILAISQFKDLFKAFNGGSGELSKFLPILRNVFAIFDLLGIVILLLAGRMDDLRAALQPVVLAFHLLDQVFRNSFGSANGILSVLESIRLALGDVLLGAIQLVARGFQILVDIFVTFVQALQGNWTDNPNLFFLIRLVGDLGVAFNTTISIINDMVKAIERTFPTFFFLESVIQNIKDAFTGAFDFGPQINDSLNNILTSVLKLTHDGNLELYKFKNFFEQELLPAIQQVYFQGLLFLASDGVQAAKDFGTGVVNALQGILDWFTKDGPAPVIEFVSFLGKLLPLLIVVFGAAALAAGTFAATVLPAIAAVRGILGPLAPLIGLVGDALATVAGIIADVLLGPIGLLLLAISALGLAYSVNLFGFRDAVNTVAKDVASFIDDTLLPALFRFKDWFTGDALPAITGFASTLEGLVTGALATFADWFTGTAIPALSGFASAVKTSLTDDAIPAVAGIWDTVSGPLGNFAGWFTGTVLTDIANFGSGVVTAFTDTALPAITGFASGALEKLQELAHWFTGEGATIVNNPPAGFMGFLSGDGQGATPGSASGFSEMFNGITESLNTIQEKISTVFDPVAGVVGTFVDAAIKELDRIKKWFTDAQPDIKLPATPFGPQNNLPGPNLPASPAIPDTTGFQNALGTLNGLLQEFQGIISGIMGPLASIFGTMASNIGTVAGIVAGFSLWLFVLNPLSAGITTFALGFIEAFGTLATTIITFGATWGTVISGMLTSLADFNAGALLILEELGIGFGSGGPIGLAIAALLVLIAVFVGAWIANVGGIRDITNEVLSAIGAALSTVGQILADTFSNPDLQNSLSQLGEAFGNLKDALVEAAPLFEAIAVVLGVVLVAAIGLLLGVVGALAGALGPLITGIALVVAGVVNVISGLILLLTGIFKTNIQVIIDLLHGDWGKAWEDAKKGVEDMVKGIGLILQGLAQIIVGIIGGLAGAVVGALEGFVKTVISFFTRLADELVGHSIIPDMINAIVDWFGQLPGLVLGVLEAFVSSIIGFFTGLASSVVNIVFDLISVITSLFGSLAGTVSGAVSGMVSSVLGFFQNLWSEAVGKVSGLVGEVIGWFSNMAGQLPSIVSGIVGSVLGFFQNLWTEAVGKISGMVTEILNKVTTLASDLIAKGESVVSGFINGIGNKLGDVTAKAGEIATNVKNALGTLASDIYTVGASVVQGFIDGMGSLIGSVTSKAGEVVSAAKNALTHPWDINSPSKVTMALGGSVIEGLVLGLDKGVRSVSQSGSDVANGLLGSFKDTLAIASPSQEMIEIAHAIIDGLLVGLDEDSLDLAKKVADVAKSITDALSSVIDFSEKLRTTNIMPIDTDKLQHLADDIVLIVSKVQEAVGSLFGDSDSDALDAFKKRNDAASSSVGLLSNVVDFIQKLADAAKALQQNFDVIGTVKNVLEKTILELNLMFDFLGSEKIGNAGKAVASAQAIGEGLGAFLDMLSKVTREAVNVDPNALGTLKLLLEKAIIELDLSFRFLEESKIQNAGAVVAVAKDIGDGFAAIINLMKLLARTPTGWQAGMDVIGDIKLALEKAILELDLSFEFLGQDKIDHAKALADNADEIGKAFLSILTLMKTLAKKGVEGFDPNSLTPIVAAMQAAMVALGNAFEQVGSVLVTDAKEFATSGADVAKALTETFKFLGQAAKIGVVEIDRQTIDTLTLNLKNMIQSFQSIFKDINTDLGDETKDVGGSAEAIADAMGKVLELIGLVAKSDVFPIPQGTIDILSDTIKQIITALYDFVAAKGLDTDITDIIKGTADAASAALEAIGKIFDVFSQSQKDLQKALDNLPSESVITQISQFIQTLVDGLYDISQDYDKDILDLTAQFANTGGAILDVFTKLADALEAIDKFVPPPATVVSSILHFLEGLVTELESVAIQFSKDSLELTTLFATTAGSILDIFSKITDALDAIKHFRQPRDKAVHQIELFFQELVQAFIRIANDFQEEDLTAAQTFADAVNGALDAINGAADFFANLTKQMLAKIKLGAQRSGEVVQLIAQFVQDMANAAGGLDGTASLGDAFAGLDLNAENWGENFLSAFHDGLMNGYKTYITRFLVNLLRDLTRFFEIDFTRSSMTWGTDMMSAFADGIRAGYGDVQNAVQRLAQLVKDLMGFSVPKLGPLSDADSYMPDFMKLLSTGISQNGAEVIKQAALLAQGVSSAMALDTSNLTGNAGFLTDSGTVVGTINFGDIVINATNNPAYDGEQAGQAAISAILRQLQARST